MQIFDIVHLNRKYLAFFKMTGLEAKEAHVCRSKVYEDRLPSSKEEFNKLLTDFYDRHGKTIQTPTLDYLPLDLEKVFRLVAAKGGYEVVTLNK